MCKVNQQKNGWTRPPPRGAVSIRCRRVRSPLLHEWGPWRAVPRDLLTPDATSNWLRFLSETPDHRDPAPGQRARRTGRRTPPPRTVAHRSRPQQADVRPGERALPRAAPPPDCRAFCGRPLTSPPRSLKSTRRRRGYEPRRPTPTAGGPPLAPVAREAHLLRARRDTVACCHQAIDPPQRRPGPTGRTPPAVTRHAPGRLTSIYSTTISSASPAPNSSVSRDIVYSRARQWYA